MAATASGSWAHAVPLDESNGFAQPNRADTMKSEDSRGSNYRDTMRSATGRRPSDFNMQSDSEAAGTRRASVRAGNASNIRKRSKNALREKQIGREEIDDSAWIHRDKLAQIEIQEMEQAGIPVRQSRRSESTGPGASRRSSRSASRSGARRRESKDRQGEQVDEQLNPQYASFDDHKRKRVSTIPAEEEEEQAFDHTADTELRTPEEVAAEQQVYKQHMIRPSTSRIPISKAGPVPVPQTVVERDSPLPRSRNSSGAWSGAWDEMQYQRRARSGSAGSQVLLDDADGVRTPSRPVSSQIRTSNENSPPKARVPGKGTPTSGARKVSANGTGRPTSSNVGKARTPSSAEKRPVSRSGHKSRPSTSHVPEGEAPWIASMYKPDPRLPPDQQMLPTHAKRMMQEQWEKDGKTGTAYDRDLNLLNDDQWQQKPQPPEPPVLKLDDKAQRSIEPLPKPRPKLSPQAENKPWPLSPAMSEGGKSDTGSAQQQRPGTSGGYKITPSIPTTPTIEQNPGSVQSQSVVDNAAPINPTPKVPRMPDYDEKQLPEPKKGCCCVMM